MTDELKHINQMIDDMRDNRVIEAAIRAHVQKAIDDEEQNPWKAALIDELIVDCIYSKEHESDPRKALAEAIEWNVKVALDPAVSKEASDMQQAAIDAALSDLIQDLGSLYIHRDGHDLYNGAIDDVARLVKGQLGTNPLAEAQARIDALEKQRASLFKEGAEAAVIAAERIAELERELSTKDWKEQMIQDQGLDNETI